MKQKTQQLVAAFAVTVIMIAALCGFAVVDLSTDRYMPAEYAPLFQITSAGPEGLAFTAMGNRYIIGPDGPLGPLREAMVKYRGFLPCEITLTGALTTRAIAAAEQWLREKNASEPNEPW